MDQSRVIAKLRKLLALVDRGVGGEKTNAESALKSLLAKHGLSIEDLDDAQAERRIFWWSTKSETEGKLLSQCVEAVLSRWDRNFYRERGNRKARGYEMTHAEWLEVDLMFAVHRRSLAKHLKKQQELAFIAYIHRNEIFGREAGEDSRESHAPMMDFGDIDAIVGMVMRMRPTPVHKAIGLRGAE